MAMLSTRSWWLKSRVLLYFVFGTSSVLDNLTSSLRISTSTAELTPLRPECSKEPTPPAADFIVGRSLALFVYVSTTSPPTLALHTRACFTTVFQPTAPLPHHAQLSKLRRQSLLYRTARVSILSSRNYNLTRRNAPALSHSTCPTSARSSLPFLLTNLRAVLTIQSQCKRFGFDVTDGRC